MVWTNLTNCIEVVGVEKEKYRETYATAFADDKIYFFGLESVDPTSENFHETCLGGTFVTVFDIKTKHFSTKKFDKVNEDVQIHREHIFAVNDVVHMYVYSKTDSYQKLYIWKNGKWIDSNVNISGNRVAADACNFHCGFLNAKDGFYMHFESGGTGRITKLEVVAEKGECKSAKLVEVLKENMDELGRFAHMTHFALNEHQIAVWYGQEMCGFWWERRKPFVGEWSRNALAKLKQIEVPEPHPGYAYGGPNEVLMRNNSLVMLGGCIAAGECNTEDNPEIWIYDLKLNAYRQSAVKMPEGFPLWRAGVAFDEHTGNIYVCDREKGIFTANVDSF